MDRKATFEIEQYAKGITVKSEDSTGDKSRNLFSNEEAPKGLGDLILRDIDNILDNEQAVSLTMQITYHVRKDTKK